MKIHAIKKYTKLAQDPDETYDAYLVRAMELHSLQQTTEVPIGHKKDKQFIYCIIAGVRNPGIAKTLTRESPDTFSKLHDIINREASMLSGHASINHIDIRNSNKKPQPGCVVCNDPMRVLETCPYVHKARKELREKAMAFGAANSTNLTTVPTDPPPPRGAEEDLGATLVSNSGGAAAGLPQPSRKCKHFLRKCKRTSEPG